MVREVGRGSTIPPTPENQPNPQQIAALKQQIAEILQDLRNLDAAQQQQQTQGTAVGAPNPFTIGGNVTLGANVPRDDVVGGRDPFKTKAIDRNEGSQTPQLGTERGADIDEEDDVFGITWNEK